MRLIENLGHVWRRLVGGSSEQPAAAEPKRHDGESDGAIVKHATSETETHRPAAEEAPPKSVEDAASEAAADDLTAIRGIGAATQKCLNAAGIRSYAQLAKADPEDVRKALNEQQQNTKVERWISQARELAHNDWRPI